MSENLTNHSNVMDDYKFSKAFKIPKLTSIISFAIIFFLIYAFFAKLTMKFYASFVFLFYSFTGSMWISVVMLGIFQTLIMIPLRIIRVIKQNNINEFKKKMKQVATEAEIKDNFSVTYKTGNKVAIFYSVDFFIQLVSYTSIGRLFLTNFYTKPLDPNLLFNFVPYPNYPIKDIFFKIPYPWFSNTLDFGMRWVWLAWLIIFGAFMLFYLIKKFRKNPEPEKQQAPTNEKLSGIVKYINANFFFLIIIAYILIRHFPIDWNLRIFTGDISHQNNTFNTVTAIVTFLTLMWFGVNKNLNKAKLAIEKKIPQNIIDKTQKDMFRTSLTSATLIGMGAYFITNHIPCAFELSIFTFEIISLTSPLTLDKIILNVSKPKPKSEPAPVQASV